MSDRGDSRNQRKRLVDVEMSVPDIAKDIILFIVRVVAAFLWLLLMLLILSFVTLGYLHFRIEYMLLASGIFAVVIAVFSGRAIYLKYKS